MSNKVKDINIINSTYYFFNDIINIENFDPNDITIDKKSYKNILFYYIGYVTIKEYIKIYSANPLYLIFRYVNGYFEEINGNKYLTLVPTNEGKEKVKFNSEDELPLYKTIEIPTMTIVVRSIFLKNNIHHSQMLSTSFLR